MQLSLSRSIAFLLLALCAASAEAQDSAAHIDSVFRDSAYHRETVSAYLMSTFGPRPTLRAIGLAGFKQLRHSPRTYPLTWRGYEDRLGSTYAQVAISHTLRSSTAWLVDERTDPFKPCVCTDSSRFRYAIETPFRVITPHGVRLSLYNPLTELVSGILVTPLRGRGIRVGEGVANGVLGIAGESAGALVRQFWPFKWRPGII